MKRILFVVAYLFFVISNALCMTGTEEVKTLDPDSVHNFTTITYQKYLQYVAAGDLENVKRIVLAKDYAGFTDFKQRLKLDIDAYAKYCEPYGFMKKEVKNPCGYCVVAELLSLERDPESQRFKELFELFKFVWDLERSLMSEWSKDQCMSDYVLQKHSPIGPAVKQDNCTIVQLLVSFLYNSLNPDKSVTAHYDFQELYLSKSPEMAQILINANWLPVLPYRDGAVEFEVTKGPDFSVTVYRWSSPYTWTVLGKKTKPEPGKKIKTD